MTRSFRSALVALIATLVIVSPLAAQDPPAPQAPEAAQPQTTPPAPQATPPGTPRPYDRVITKDAKSDT